MRHCVVLLCSLILIGCNGTSRNVDARDAKAGSDGSGGTEFPESPEIPEVPEAPRCPRYQEEIEGSCRNVQVFGIEETEFSFERDGYTLDGTLTLPQTEGEYFPPVFVIANGTPYYDRDADAFVGLSGHAGKRIPGHRLLAEALTQEGAAVYRYDMRMCFSETSAGRCPKSLASYPGNVDVITMEDLLEDLQAAIDKLATREDLGGDDVTVIGHGFKANFVPKLVEEGRAGAGVLISASALPVDERKEAESRHHAERLEAAGQAEGAKIHRDLADRFAAVFRSIRAGTFEETYFDGVAVRVWMNWIELTDNLEEEFKSVHKPLLLLQSEVDHFAFPFHFEAYQRWVEEAEMENVSFFLAPRTTQFFAQMAEDSADLEAPLSQRVIDTIVSWHRGL